MNAAEGFVIAFEAERTRLEVEWANATTQCAGAGPDVQYTVDEVLDLASDVIDFGAGLNRVARGLANIARDLANSIEENLHSANEVLKFANSLNALTSDSTDTARSLMQVVQHLVRASS